LAVGAPGLKGVDGKAGPAGKDGAPGKDGKDGRRHLFGSIFTDQEHPGLTANDPVSPWTPSRLSP
jgi:hypothetical protein